MDKTSIIIPCYRPNYIDKLTKCLSSIEVEAEILPIISDLSYANNVNIGLKAATGDYLVVSNNDIEFIQPDWLDHLLKPLKEGYSISSIRTSDSDGFATENEYEEDAKFGSIWAITRSTLTTLGFLEEGFGRGYYEDQDYWRRARVAGLRVVKNHAGLVEHAGKGTFKEVDPEGWDLMHAVVCYKRKWKDECKLWYNPSTNGVLLVDNLEETDPRYILARKGCFEIQADDSKLDKYQ